VLPAGTIPGLDLVQPLLFQVWNEGASAYLTKNVAKYNPLVDTSNPDFEEGNLKHSINGYLYCNMPDVSAHLLPTLYMWGLIGCCYDNIFLGRACDRLI
jgi:hypothetical protein